MQNIRTGLLVLVALVTSGCVQDHEVVYPDLVDNKLMQVRLQPEQLREDLDFAIARISELHPDMAARLDQNELATLRQDLAKHLRAPMSRRELFRAIGLVTEKFQDGHAGILFPYQEYDDFTQNDGLIFPLWVEADEQLRIFVKGDFREQPGLPVGTELLAINGVPTQSLLRSMARYARGETESLRTQIVVNDFPQWLWHLHALTPEFTVSYQGPGGDIQSATLNGITQKKFEAKKMAATGAGAGDYYYKSMAGNVGYLNVSYFGGDEGDFENFLDATATTLRNENKNALLIDLRDNPGGSTDHVEILLRYFADKTFTLVSSVKERLNEHNTGLFSRGKLGEIVAADLDSAIEPRPENERFPGKVYVLVGRYTYSAAIVMATTVQDHKFGELIGEQTGGYANQTGQIYFFNLPHSNLRAFAATRLLVRPSGSTEQAGVVPEHLVSVSADDLRQGKDAVLEFGLRLANSATRAPLPGQPLARK